MNCVHLDNNSLYEAERHRPAPRPGAAPLVPFLAAPRVGRAAVWASVPFGTYQVAGASQMGCSTYLGGEPGWGVFSRQTPKPD